MSARTWGRLTAPFFAVCIVACSQINPPIFLGSKSTSQRVLNAARESPAVSWSNSDTRGKPDKQFSLVTCNEKRKDAGAKLWRLTRRQWQNAMTSLGATPSLDGFPPDPESGTYDTSPNGLQLRNEHEEFFRTAAEKHAPAVAETLRKNVVCAQSGFEALRLADCRAAFVRHAASRAFRMVPDAETIASLTGLMEILATTGNPQDWAHAMTRYLLRSPRFLTRTNLGSTDAQAASFARASLLSFGLTDSPPDERLFALAENGQLMNGETYRAEAHRLLATPQGKEKFLDFASQWLGIKKATAPSRSMQVFPDYSAAVYQEMLKETTAFLSDDVFTQKASIRGVFSSTTGHLTPVLDAFYRKNPLGATQNASGAPTKTDLSELGRFGVLTHGAVIVSMSSESFSNPIHRAARIKTHFLCAKLPSPPPDAGQIAAQLPAPPMNSTQKESYVHFMGHAPSACASCHSTFVPAGLALENFDADGRYRTHQFDKELDTGGEFTMTDGARLRFTDGPSFLKEISDSHITSQCVLVQAHSFHWGDSAISGHSCAIEAAFSRVSPDSTFLDTYLAPLLENAFLEAW